MMGVIEGMTWTMVLRYNEKHDDDKILVSFSVTSSGYHLWFAY